MAIHAALHHLTHYRYDRPVTLGPQILRLQPAPHSRTKVLSYSLKVSPAGHFANLQQDAYGNHQARFVFPEPVRELKIEVDLVADMTVYNPFDFFVEPEAEIWAFDYPARHPRRSFDLPQARSDRPLSCEIRRLDRPDATEDGRHDRRSQHPAAARDRLRHSDGSRRADARGNARTRAGSCRDTAWLLVQVCRHLGLAARFVSGYLIQLKPDLVAIDGPRGTDHDFTDLHAWCEVYLPGAGWIGLDPTSGLLTGESHIPLAATPHYRNAAPISGLASHAEVDFAFDMRVTRIAEHPRISKPFSDESWLALDRLGARGRSGAAGRGCPADAGWRADFCFNRRFRGPGMEH